MKLIQLVIFCSISLSITAQDTYDGYTFFSNGKSAYLYDMDKKLVHEWKSTFNSAATAHLLRDSSVMYSGRDVNGWSGGVLHGGRIQRIMWNGDLAWDFQYSSSEYCPHHNMEVIYYTDDPKEVPNVMLSVYFKDPQVSRPDKLVEIKPTGLNTGEIVWEWNCLDHTTNSPKDKPELLDINLGSSGGMGDWTHVNNISHNRELDQLIVDLKTFHEIIILDHSTTTEEAKGSAGGKYGKGGDILYRWGQASNYGISGNDYLSGFHGGAWVDNICPRTLEKLPGGGNIVIFHNDKGEVLEFTPPGNGDGVYPRDPGKAFGPASPVWSKKFTLGRHEGSIQKLPNGNYLIGDTKGPFEITSDGKKIWELSEHRCNQARRYSYKYLDPSVVDNKDKGITKTQLIRMHMKYNRLEKLVTFHLSLPVSKTIFQVYSLKGKRILSQTLDQNTWHWHTRNQAAGTYLITVKNKNMNRYITITK